MYAASYFLNLIRDAESSEQLRVIRERDFASRAFMALPSDVRLKIRHAWGIAWNKRQAVFSA